MQVSKQMRQECGAFLTQRRALTCIDCPAFLKWGNGLGHCMIHTLIKLRLRVDVKVRSLTVSPRAKSCHLYVRYARCDQPRRLSLDYDFAGAAGAKLENDGRCNLIIVPAVLPELVTGLTEYYAPVSDFNIPNLIAMIEWLRKEEILVCPVESIGRSIGPTAKANSFLSNNRRYGTRTVIPARRKLVGCIWR